MVLAGLLVGLCVLALICMWLTRRATSVRWLFIVLSVALWVAFFVLLGFETGYVIGLHGGIHLHR
jgi:hypothetical protein